MRHYRLLFVVVFAVVLLFATTNERTAAASDPVKILFIGNSFSEDTSLYLYNIAKSNGKNAVVAEAHIGGIGLEGHWRNIQQNKASYRYVRYEAKGWSQQRGKTLRQVLQSDDWDVVFMQQNSPNSGDYSTFQPYLNNIRDYVLKTVKNPTRVKTGLNATWAYATSYYSYPSYAKTQLTMYNAITQAYKKAISSAPYDYIIPSGTAIQNARANDIIDKYGTELTRDGIHLDASIGRYTAGLAAYKTIFGQNESKGDFFVQPQNTEEQVILKRYINAVVDAAVAAPHVFTFVDVDDIKYTYYRQRITPSVTKVSDTKGNIYTNLSVKEIQTIKTDIEAFLKRANVKALTDNYAALFKKMDARIQDLNHTEKVLTDLRTRYKAIFTITEAEVTMTEGRPYRQYVTTLNELTAHAATTEDMYTLKKISAMTEQIKAYMAELDDTYTLFFNKVTALQNIFHSNFNKQATEILAMYPTVSTVYSLEADVVSKVEDIEAAKKDYDAFQETIANGQAYTKEPLITTDTMKEWRITFTEALANNFREGDVYVVNQFGQPHDVTIAVEGTKLLISPTQPYQLNTAYYVVVDEWLRGETSLLKQQQYISFIVND
ncbi:DUF4886 domain-containing protein [Caryophanon tenue]|uniref:DUF4886 domain-containing protein n=1 Tax=Caryophanon tenue TaxID=33978 RepID=A0A1C0Y6N8_9BACL|nr:DUF4886 domain-containing protein [Caryophanon tenue]OCS82847.1 hypothetical protein A6M13_05460 [Caryophanon tenue]